MAFIRMKNRVFILFLVCVFCTTGLFLFMTTTSLGNRRESGVIVLNKTVEQTQNQINNLKKNFKTPPSLLFLDMVETDYLYLLELDDGENNVFWPDCRWAKNGSEPVIVSSVNNGESGQAVQFLRNTLLFLPNHTIILYDLGMSRHELNHATQFCNSTRCQIRAFEFSSFPSHALKSIRPLIIQLVLKDAGSVLWLDLRQLLTTGNLTSILKPNPGVVTWLMEQTTPTSALTHPRMFEHLGITVIEEFNFQHMVDLKALVIYNTEEIHSKLIDPWVRCSLIEECVEPIGSQSSGCKFDKKPGYRYSGCHAYDVSALNVVLGLMFDFDESKYISREGKFFVKMFEDADSSHSINSTLEV